MRRHTHTHNWKIFVDEKHNRCVFLLYFPFSSKDSFFIIIFNRREGKGKVIKKKKAFPGAVLYREVDVIAS
jgi:hypothetical protein